MSAILQVKPPVWFWVAAALSLLWNLMGAYACYSQLTISPEALAALPADQQDAWRAMTMLPKAAYVIAVAAGLLGAIALLARKAGPARGLFMLSLIAVIVQFGWFFGPYGGLQKLGASAAIFPAFIAIVCLVEIWFAGYAHRRGWMA